MKTCLLLLAVLLQDEPYAAALKRCFPEGAAIPAPGRVLFEAALAGEAFLKGEAGPLDVYVYRADGLSSSSDAKKTLAAALEGLQPLLPVLERRFGRARGAISGQRFPVVLCSARPDKGGTALDEILALLDRCEDGGYSDWKPDQLVFTDANRSASVSRTWEVLVVDLALGDVADQGKGWLEHGLGYEVVNQLVNRLFAKGCWGAAPPWLREGLVDELDIEAYGSAYVAGGESTSSSSRSSGWGRKGWSGFVPQGKSPPKPVTGPPPNLPTSVSSRTTSDAWISRGSSSSRHWSEIAADRKSAAPASLRAMAAGQDWQARDRAYARCLLFALLELAPQVDLLAELDVESARGQDGMRDAEALPLAFARALGGLPEVEALEARPLRAKLEAMGRQDLSEKIVQLGAEPMLAFADHREMAEWLYVQQVDSSTRLALWEFIVEAEACEEVGQWEVIGAALDSAMNATLREVSSFPKTEDQRTAAGEALTTALP